jgi:hypothetical protein
MRPSPNLTMWRSAALCLCLTECQSPVEVKADFIFGISENHSEAFSLSSAYRGDMDTLQQGLNIKSARKIVDDQRTTDYIINDLREWLGGVKARKLEPYVTISVRKTGQNDDVNEVEASSAIGLFSLLLDEFGKEVEFWSPLNEPNKMGFSEKTAAQFWVEARRIANKKCPSCAIIAGEFGDYPDRDF